MFAVKYTEASTDPQLRVVGEGNYRNIDAGLSPSGHGYPPL